MSSKSSNGQQTLNEYIFFITEEQMKTTLKNTAGTILMDHLRPHNQPSREAATGWRGSCNKTMDFKIIS